MNVNTTYFSLVAKPAASSNMLKLFDSPNFSGRYVQLANSISFIRNFNDKAESYEITGMLVNVCFHIY